MKWGEPYSCPKAALAPFPGCHAGVGPGRNPDSSSSSESLGQGDRDSNSVAGIWGNNTSKDRATERGSGEGERARDWLWRSAGGPLECGSGEIYWAGEEPLGVVSQTIPGTQTRLPTSWSGVSSS